MEFVTFEIAKKLKEKGYPQHIADDAYIVDNYGEEDYQIGDRLPIPIIPDFMDDVSAPTISQVLKWLREDKNIHIAIGYSGETDWRYVIIHLHDEYFNNPNIIHKNFTSYEEAALAGIEYVLDNLI